MFFLNYYYQNATAWRTGQVVADGVDRSAYVSMSFLSLLHPSTKKRLEVSRGDALLMDDLYEE